MRAGDKVVCVYLRIKRHGPAELLLLLVVVVLRLLGREWLRAVSWTAKSGGGGLVEGHGRILGLVWIAAGKDQRTRLAALIRRWCLLLLLRLLSFLELACRLLG